MSERTHPIPKDALDDRLAFVGTAGSGKTYNAGSGVERLLARKARVVIADPLGVWWGLRLKPDGRTESGFDVVIFGGPHGDIAINEHAGALIGETVAGMAESCIVDLSQIGTKAGERRFMLAFLTALYRKTTGEPVHLVVDEADMFAPQRLLDKDGEAAKLLGMMETIVRRGRVKGFIPWLITQRPAVLSKDVLSQADGMIAFKLTASQDRAAIGAWIEGQADQAQGKAILSALPGMQRGQGVVWVPGRGILETASFPEKQTFDSSRTPKRGETKRTAELRPLDLGKLKERLSTIETEAKANDPKALKAEIAKLKRDLAAKPAAQAPAVDPQAVETAYQNGLAEGLARGENRAKAALAAVESRLKDALAVAGASIESLDSPMPMPRRQVAVVPVRAAPSKVIPTNGVGHGALSNALQKVINAIGWWEKIGRTPVEKARACVVAGYSPKASTFSVYLAELSRLGMVETPQPGKISLTDAGRALADVPQAGTADELRDVARGLLGPQEVRVFDVVYEAYPNSMRRNDVAEGVGLSPTASTTSVYLAAVAAYGLIENSGRGEVRAADWLFPR